MSDMESNERNQAAHWERGVLEKIALEGIAEQRRARRWGIFFKLLGLAYLGVFLLAISDWNNSVDQLGEGQAHTALVQIHGVIQAKGSASAENVMTALQSAFKSKGTRGIILSINSPGGSPVQAGMINDEIARLRAKYPQVPLYVVVEDYCASGGYYVAVAADKIFVDKASVVGSVGVLMDGFGFTGTLDKLGVERRLMTSGDNKGFLDPFSPQNPAHLAHAQKLLDEVHQQFIDAVRKRRGQRLKETPEIFSGLMWSGARSVEMGLADDFGTVESVARDVIKAEHIRDYTVEETFAERFSKRLGASMADSALGALSSLGQVGGGMR